ncbi:tRNA pseudouridine(38-40) synthase TruA [Fusibacter bizertensis]|uniref:tRNA pseudouridine synthase A n=1 Tax=Fusibacter bizertensis TaxID=1488331 RepID=A0ABT6NDE0_9FIRM|nr:tRNA pseudouridine(38-40) synthase TruA [Fusibacter bizertensis]MDH8678440.1 tRNA pseudouridine(38-40) synthase TruA [Fusibacter bizertensis]
MKNFKMTIAYDGRKYMGFSERKGNPDKAVQGKLEMILTKMYNTYVEVVSACNTEAGVHAKRQIVNFIAPEDTYDCDGVFEYFEKYLPDDIIILSVEIVDERFHSRYLVKSLSFEYRIWKHNAPRRPLFERHQVNVLNQVLNVKKMKEAAISFVGEHNFIAFSTNTKVKNTFKKIYEVAIQESETEIIIIITANGFLLNMERLIVGTLIQIGTGQLPVNAVEMALQTCKTDYVGHKAMSDALSLVEVNY